MNLELIEQYGQDRIKVLNLQYFFITKNISRKDAKAQRKTSCFLCAFAPLREEYAASF
jgi:hypothetical protein